MGRKYVNRKKKNFKMLLLLAVLGLVIGFAAIATTLKINGILNINKNTWNIKWDSTSVVMGNDMLEGTVEPTVSTSISGSTDDTVSFEADLSLPGDHYEFYIDAVNLGTINGEVAEVVTTWRKDTEPLDELPDFLEYTIVYADNDEIPAEGDILYAGQARTYKIRLEYKSSSNELQSEDSTYEGIISLVYSQGDKTPAPASGSGPATAKMTELADDAPAEVPKETKNPVRTLRAAVPNSSPDADSLEEGEELSYMGGEPNNFIYFNCDSLDTQDSDHCELWRIIGTDKDNGDRLKIIRNESIGKFQFDDYDVENNYDDATMSNFWPNSSLYTYLNGTYYNSLKTEAKKLIPTVTWYTAGGYNVLRLNSKRSWDGDQYSAMAAGALYVNERTKFLTNNINFQRSNVQAKVGLMYASDYAYASAACYSDCTSTGGHPCMYDDRYCIDEPEENNVFDFIGAELYNKVECRESNWLYAGLSEWTMTANMLNDNNSFENWSYRSNSYYQHSDSWNGVGSQYCQNPNRERLFESTYPTDLSVYPENYHYVFVVSNYYNQRQGEDNRGMLGETWTDQSRDVRPVVYLKSGIDLAGTGSRQDPYTIIASADVLNGEDVISSGGSSDEEYEPETTHTSDSGSCSDRKVPQCIATVRTSTTGLTSKLICNDNVGVDNMVATFTTNPSSLTSLSFDQIGELDNGISLNATKKRMYSRKWSTIDAPSPESGTCYYLVYGAKDACGNYSVYQTPDCYELDNE